MSIYGIDYYYIGKKFYKNGEYEKALEYCERSGALEPHYSVYELMFPYSHLIYDHKRR